MLYLNPPYFMIDGVSLLPDHVDPLQFYFMPMEPHLSTIEDSSSGKSIPKIQVIKFSGRDGSTGDLVNGGYYIIRNGDGETTFKRYIENPARLEPCSSNPEHQAIYPGQSPFEVIGRVRKKVTDL